MTPESNSVLAIKDIHKEYINEGNSADRVKIANLLLQVDPTDSPFLDNMPGGSHESNFYIKAYNDVLDNAAEFVRKSNFKEDMEERIFGEEIIVYDSIKSSRFSKEFFLSLAPKASASSASIVSSRGVGVGRGK